MKFLPRQMAPLAAIFVLVLTAAGCGSETAGGGGTPNPSSSSTTLVLEPWEPVGGLDGGVLKSLTAEENRLVVLGESALFEWTDTAGFSLLPDTPSLSSYGLAEEPSPFAGPAFEFLFGAPPSLFAVVGGELFRFEGDRWIDSGEKAHSLAGPGGTFYLRRQGEILESGDGVNWTLLTEIPSEAGEGVCCLSPPAPDPVRDRLYLFNSNGVFAYGLANGQWSAMEPGDDLFQGPLTQLRTIFTDPSSGDVYVGTIFDLYVSTDGQSWSPPLFKQQTGVWGTAVSAMTRDSATGALYVATSRGVFSGTGIGPWNPLPPIETTPNAMIVRDGVLWAASSDGLRSFKPGSGWTVHETSGLRTKNVQAMEFSGGFLFVQTDEILHGTLPGSDDVGADFHAVYKQVAPDSWVQEKRLVGMKTSVPALDASLGQTVFARLTINSKDLRVAATPSGVVISLDEGPWTISNDGLPTFRITSFAYDTNAQTLYAGTHGHGVFRLALDSLSAP
jgi:hypothetical protein